MQLKALNQDKKEEAEDSIEDDTVILFTTDELKVAIEKELEKKQIKKIINQTRNK